MSASVPYAFSVLGGLFSWTVHNIYNKVPNTFY